MNNYHTKIVTRWMNALTAEELIDYYPGNKEKAYNEVEQKLPEFFEEWGENWDDPFLGTLEQRLTGTEPDLAQALEDFNKKLQHAEIIILEPEDEYGGFGSIGACDSWRNQGGI